MELDEEKKEQRRGKMVINLRRFVVLTVLFLAILLAGSFLVKGSLAQNNAVYYFEVNPQVQNFPVYPVTLPTRDQLLRGGVQFYGVDFAHPWRADRIYAVSPSQKRAVFAPGARFSFFAQGLESSGDIDVWKDPLAPRKRNLITSWVPGYVIGRVENGSWYALVHFRPVSARGNLEDNEVIKGYLVHLIPPGGGYLKNIDPLSGQGTIIQDPVLVVVPSEVCVESSTGQLISSGKCLGQSQGVNFSILSFTQATVTPVPPTPTLRPWATYTPVPATPTPRSRGQVSGQTPPEYVDVVAKVADLRAPDLWDFMRVKAREVVPDLNTQSAVDQKVQEIYLVTKRDFGGIKLASLFGRAVIIPGQTKIRIPFFDTGILAQVPPGQVPQRPGAQQTQRSSVPTQTAGGWVIYDLVDEAHEIAGMYGVSHSKLDEAVTVGYNPRNPSRSAAVIVHDTGTHATTSTGEHLTALGLVRSCARSAHTRMICYHFFIDTDGRIYQIQGLGKRVAHAGAYYNYGSLGVSLNGMDALPIQRQSLKVLLKWLLQTYNLPPVAIKGHKEVAAKQDPQHIDMDALRRELATMQPVSDPIVIDASGSRENSLPGLPDGSLQGNLDSAGATAQSGSGQLGIAWMPWTVTRWSNLILEKSRAFGVDPKLTAVMVAVESCGNQQAFSRSGSVGLMQVMSYNANGKDLYDPSENLEAGLSYLVKMYQQFHDWSQAVTAYNDGPGNVRRGTVSAQGRRYYTYVTGMWQEANLAQSDVANRWLREQGASLCAAAESSPGPENWNLQ